MSVKIINLKTNNRSNPLGIDEKPVFSWQADIEKQGWFQSTYGIRVAQEPNFSRVLWDSGRVESSRMIHIPYEGPELTPKTRYYWQAEVWDNGEECSALSEKAWFETGMGNEPWQGVWIGEEDDLVVPACRKIMELEQEPVKARLYICGLGHFEAHINGNPASDYVLEPGWTDYNKTCFYVTYDITSHLRKGKNTLLVFLGNGMFNVPNSRYVYYERSFGKAKLLARMEIFYGDGTRKVFVTDESWLFAKSPVTFSGMYGGEEYDGRIEAELSGENAAFDAACGTWRQAMAAAPPGGHLTAQRSLPLKVMESYPASSVREISAGVFLYDFGKNFSGWIRAEFDTNGLASGMEVEFIPGEILDENSFPDQRVTGRGYRWSYILNGKKSQIYSPKFTYYGFRYVAVKGAVPREYAGAYPALPVISDIHGGFIYPEMEARSTFWCSNSLYNSIHGIITQAIRSNTKSYFTDCPHRERLGWLEQTHLIGPAVLLNYDLYSLYSKIEGDMADAQHENGLIPCIAPEYVKVFERWHAGFLDSPEWGSAIIINPWLMYEKYGDLSLFHKYYPEMKRYVEYLTGKLHHFILHHGLGDWLDIGPNTPHSQNTPVPVIATGVFYRDLVIMGKVAALLGKTEDEARFKKLGEAVRREFNLQFYDRETGRYATGSQAAQAISLVTGLAREETVEKVLEVLVRDIEKRGWQMTAGDIGHPFVTAALIDFNRSDIYERMMSLTDHPGYGYQVEQGATTLAEEWDGPDPKGPHGSQNHYMLGSGEEWFWAGLGGIRLFRTGRPFDEILLRPHFPKEMEALCVSHNHPYGKIHLEWKREGCDSIGLKVRIPPNTRAVLVFDKNEDKRELLSGTYEFCLKTWTD